MPTAVQSSLKGFLAGVLGDMRQPLSAVQVASQLLAQRPCVQRDEEATFLVAAISAACQMLTARAQSAARAWSRAHH
jgi:hypothetical protein